MQPNQNWPRLPAVWHRLQCHRWAKTTLTSFARLNIVVQLSACSLLCRHFLVRSNNCVAKSFRIIRDSWLYLLDWIYVFPDWRKKRWISTLASALSPWFIPLDLMEQIQFDQTLNNTVHRQFWCACHRTGQATVTFDSSYFKIIILQPAIPTNLDQHRRILHFRIRRMFYLLRTQPTTNQVYHNLHIQMHFRAQFTMPWFTYSI